MSNKIRAAQENIPLMTEDGWIVQKLEQALKAGATSDQVLDWTKTEDFKKLARDFCKSEGWIEPQTVKKDSLEQLKAQGLEQGKDYSLIKVAGAAEDKICLTIAGIKKILQPSMKK